MGVVVPPEHNPPTYAAGRKSLEVLTGGNLAILEVRF